MIIAYFMWTQSGNSVRKNAAIKEWVVVFSANQVPIIASISSYHFCYTFSVSMSCKCLEFLVPLLGHILLFYLGVFLLSGAVTC